MIGFLLLAAGLLSSCVQDQSYVEKLPDSTVEFKMVPVPGGTVKVGDKEVKVAPFFMGATEVPWEVFDAFLLSGEPSPPYDQTDFAPDVIARPSRSYILPDLGWGHQGYPVINVSSTNVEMFLRWLRSVTHKKYRLATEAEWQFACEGGSSGPWPPAKDVLDKEAWYAPNSGDLTHPVGKKEPNGYGLYDMLGNVGEWCKDMAGKDVLCGGDFTQDASQMTPFERRYWSPDWQTTDPQIPKSRWWLSDGFFVGFRLVCDK